MFFFVGDPCMRFPLERACHSLFRGTGGNVTEIRRLREHAGLTQFETARLAKVDRSRLALAEGGQLPLSDEQETRLRSTLLRAIRSRRDRLNALLAKTNPESVTELTGLSA